MTASATLPPVESIEQPQAEADYFTPASTNGEAEADDNPADKPGSDGRTGIGTDLSGDYLALARTRIDEDRRQRKHGKKPKRAKQPKGEPLLFGAA